MGPAPYGTEGDRLVAYFGMIAGQHDCPDIRSARSTPAPQGGYYIETSEPASACIDTPATEPAG